MAGQGKEMGAQGLENYLNQQFPGNNHISTLMAHLRDIEAKLKDKESGKRNPFFYAEFRNQIELRGDKNLDNWIDNNGNIKTSQIDVVAKIAVKKFEVVKQEEKTKKQESTQNYQAQTLEQQEEIIKQELKKIDYDNLTVDNLTFIAQNMELFRNTASYDDYSKGIETMGSVMDIKTTVVDWLKLAKFQNDYPDKLLDEKQSDVFSSVPEELKMKDGKSFNQIKMKQLDKILGSVYIFIIGEIDQKKLPTQDEIMNCVHNKMEELECEFSEELLNQVFEIGLIKELEGKSQEEQEVIISKKIQEQNERHKAENNLDKKEETPKDLEDEIFSALAEDNQEQSQVVEDASQKIEAQMQEENEKMMNAEFEQTQDYSQLSQEVSLEDDSEFFAALAEYDEEQKWQAQEVPKQADELAAEEQPQPSAPEEIDAEDQDVKNYREETTFEDNGPGGILGFLSAMASKFIPKKLQERFMQKDKTKQLSAGEPEVTRENGILQKSYYGNGTLQTSLFKQFRTKSIEIAGSVMSAISKMAGLSDKSEENAVKNRPIVIKSEEQKEQPKEELDKTKNVMENSRTTENSRVVVEKSKTVEIPNSFDQRYSIHNQASQYYMTDEEFAEVSKNVMAKSNETHDKAVETKEGRPDVEQEGQEI